VDIPAVRLEIVEGIENGQTFQVLKA